MTTKTGPGQPFNNNLSDIILRLLALFVLDAFALWFIYQTVAEGGVSLFLAVAVGIITIGVNIIFLREDMYPLRWFSPGLALMILLVAYPVLFTTYAAFTNYGTGNLLTKAQAIEQLEKVQYLPEGGAVYKWTAFRSDAGEFILWVIPPTGEPLLLGVDTTLNPDTMNLSLDADGIPESIPGYQRLNRIQSVRYVSELDKLQFGTPPNSIQVGSLDQASALQQRYHYDAEQNAMIDQSADKVYHVVEGTFTADDGEILRPGFYVLTGLDNYQRLFGSPAFRGPFIRIFLWTFAYAILSVGLTFALGLFFAIVYDDPTLPGRKIIRSLLLIPYAIPAFISVQMWRGLLNPSLGVVSTTIASIFGSAPPWFANEWWAKIGVLFVQLWLGFPYMMLICTGSLQAIPSDLYEAAEVDGATAWQQFRAITLPLLLVAVGPLLIASFAFNFNNFTVIDVYNQGGPPIPNSPTQAGHTDILVTYIFRLAFASGRGVDYGYASAITIIIFAILAVIVLFQFRYTRVWEEVSENV